MIAMLAELYSSPLFRSSLHSALRLASDGDIDVVTTLRHYATRYAANTQDITILPYTLLRDTRPHAYAFERLRRHYYFVMATSR